MGGALAPTIVTLSNQVFEAEAYKLAVVELHIHCVVGLKACLWLESMLSLVLNVQLVIITCMLL